MNKIILKNNLLIAMPTMHDSIFSKSVILITDHNIEGTAGFIINKPITNHSQALISQKISSKIKFKVYFGGPVNLDMYFILHDNSYVNKNSQSISKTLYSTTNQQIIDDIKNGNGPEKYKFNMGYAGWEVGQLENEIKKGDWLLMPNPKNFIFDVTDSQKWFFAIKKLGLDYQEPWGCHGGQA